MFKNLTLLLTFIFSINSYADLSITSTCLNEDESKELIVTHSNDTAYYSVISMATGDELGNGNFTDVIVGFDGFLQTVVFAYQSENSVAGIVIDSEDFTSVESIPNGLYTAKSDAFIDLGSEIFDGSTLNCSVDINQQQ